MRYCSNYFLWIESYGIFLSLEEINKDRNSQNLQFNVFRHIANICPLQILPISIAQELAIFVKTIGILISCLLRTFPR